MLIDLPDNTSVIEIFRFAAAIGCAADCSELNSKSKIIFTPASNAQKQKLDDALKNFQNLLEFEEAERRAG